MCIRRLIRIILGGSTVAHVVNGAFFDDIWKSNNPILYELPGPPKGSKKMEPPHDPLVSQM